MTVTSRILVGDVREELVRLEAESVQCVVTSPPYWRLRDYGVDGQLGLEETPEGYIEEMAAVFGRVRELLKPDGTLWLNLGDCYSADDKWGGASGAKTPHYQEVRKRRFRSGLKNKDLVGIPWRVALRLQSDGWFLRSDVVWHKPNPTPESVTDRPSRSHEYLFLLSKSRRYYYDQDAIRVEHLDGERGLTRKRDKSKEPKESKLARHHHPITPGNRIWAHPKGKNRGTVWTIPTQPFPALHFATFPPALVEPCILAGSRPGDTVLDPFAGAGTTGLVASRTKRNFIGVELNPEYAELARARIRDDAPLLNSVG